MGHSCWQGRGDLTLLLASSGPGEMSSSWILSRCGAHSAFPEDVQVQEGRRVPPGSVMATGPPAMGAHMPHRAGSTPGMRVRTCRNPRNMWEWLSSTAQRSCRRGTRSGAGQAQSFPQHFQVCGCPQVNRKRSMEKADQLLGAQQHHWGQTKQKNKVSRAEISFYFSPSPFQWLQWENIPSHAWYESASKACDK